MSGIHIELLYTVPFPFPTEASFTCLAPGQRSSEQWCDAVASFPAMRARRMVAVRSALPELWLVGIAKEGFGRWGNS